jgi:diacylglycerol O-acyltransferase / wax synthase
VPREVVFDRKMNEAEALMWRLEKDPFFSSTFANVTILDRPVDFERLSRRMERTSIAMPRLRQRVQPAPLPFAPPTWVDDADFSIDRHVRLLRLARPGTLRQLLDAASAIATSPFDRAHPLWEFVAIDGLSGGKSALIQKLHHTVADGEGTMRLSLQFLDLTADAPEPEPLVYVPPVQTAGFGTREAVKDLVADAIKVPLGVARSIGHALADPAQLPALGQGFAATASAIARQLGDNDPIRSPLWTSRSLARRVEMLRVPLEPCKHAAKQLGGTLNTAFLTVAADAAGQYHRDKGHPVETLRSSMAVSTRSADNPGSNSFSLARFLVPTGEMAVKDRFHQIETATQAAREQASDGSLSQMAALAGTMPTPLLLKLARSQASGVDFATSNVRAAPFPVYIAGARILQNHPIGPLAGVAFNLTLLSYDGSLDMGLNVDPAAVADADVLRRLLLGAFRRFAKSSR